MLTRRPVALLVAVLLVTLAGCSLVTGGPPEVTVENRDAVDYRVTAYSMPGIDTAAEVGFLATTASGDRRYVGPADLWSGNSYRNVTVAAENAVRASFTAPGNATTTETVEGWERGDATVYLVERGAQNETLVALKIVTCERAGQTVQLTIEDGGYSSGSSTCG